MFGIGAPEFTVILILALIVFGPERLPQIAGQIGRTVREFQRQASEMQSTFTEAFDEANIKKDLKDIPNLQSAFSIPPETSTSSPASPSQESTTPTIPTSFDMVATAVDEGEKHPAFHDFEQPSLVAESETTNESVHGLAAHDSIPIQDQKSDNQQDKPEADDAQKQPDYII